MIQFRLNTPQTRGFFLGSWNSLPGSFLLLLVSLSCWCKYIHLRLSSPMSAVWFRGGTSVSSPCLSRCRPSFRTVACHLRVIVSGTVRCVTERVQLEARCAPLGRLILTDGENKRRKASHGWRAAGTNSGMFRLTHREMFLQICSSEQRIIICIKPRRVPRFATSAACFCSALLLHKSSPTEYLKSNSQPRGMECL